jgi:hypothetical protein
MQGDFSNNREKAKIYSQEVYKRGFLPICVQIYLEDATGMTEQNGKREELLNLGKEMLLMCDELWIFGDRISKGMEGEILLAAEKGIIIRRII